MKRSQSPELRKAVLRLTLQFTGLMLLIVVLLVGVIFAIVNQSAAEANTEALVDATHIDSPQDAPKGTWIAVWRNGALETSHEQITGLPDLAAREKAAAAHAPVRTTIDRDGRTLDVLTVAGENGEVQVARDQHETKEELARLLLALVIAGGIAAVCSAVGSAWMARRAIQPLADALDLQRRFVADASHELRTPLTLLSTRAQLARRRLAGTGTSATDAHILKDLKGVVEDAQKLAGILEDLLIAADTRSAPPDTAIDVATIAKAAITATEAAASQRSVEIRSGVMQNGATVIASGSAIERLFIALLDNAIDHARSQIEVTVTIKGKTVIACISDDGPGFTELAKARAFERFATSREEKPIPDAPRHYGIGLALVAEIAGRAGGGVRIEDPPDGTGASILVDLPYTP